MTHSALLGGHSHTFLGKLKKAEGDYPTIVKNLDDEEVFVVTAGYWGQVLGRIDVSFEAGASGRILKYSGEPILMDHNTKQDPELQAKVNAWKEPFEKYAKEPVGFSPSILDANACNDEECEFNFCRS